MFGDKAGKEIREYLQKLISHPNAKYIAAGILFSLILADTIYSYYEDFTIITHDVRIFFISLFQGIYEKLSGSRQYQASYHKKNGARKRLQNISPDYFERQ